MNLLKAVMTSDWVGSVCPHNLITSQVWAHYSGQGPLHCEERTPWVRVIVPGMPGPSLLTESWDWRETARVRVPGPSLLSSGPLTSTRDTSTSPSCHHQYCFHYKNFSYNLWNAEKTRYSDPRAEGLLVWFYPLSPGPVFHYILRASITRTHTYDTSSNDMKRIFKKQISFNRHRLAYLDQIFCWHRWQVKTSV